MSSTTVIRYSQTESFTPTVVSRTNLDEGLGWDTNVDPATANFTNLFRESKILETKFGGDILTSFGGISSTRCRAVIEGIFTVNVTCVGPGINSSPEFSIDRLPYALPFDINYTNTNNSFGPVGRVHTYSLPPYSNLVVSGSGLLLDTPSVDNVTDAFGTALRLLLRATNTQNTISPTTASTASTFSGTITRTWEATTHFIDGVGGDSMPTMEMVSTMSCSATVIKDPSFLFLNTASTFAESSANLTFAPETTLSSSCSFSVTPLLLGAPPIFVDAEFIFIASTNNLVFFEEKDITSEFNTTCVGNIVRGGFADLAATADTSTAAGMIYDIIFTYTWNSFNLSTYFVAGYVVVDYSQQEEYHWDDLANDSWDDWTYDIWEGQEESWDGWPDDVWDRTFDLPMVANTSNVGGMVRGAVSNFLSQFFVEDNSAFLESGAAAFASAFTTTTSAKGIISIESDISAEFQTSTTDNIIRGGSANLESALSFSVSVKLTTDITDTESSEFTFAVTPTVLRIVTGAFSSNFTLDSTAGRIFRVTQTFSSALAFVVEVRMVTQADPYFTITVPQEVRIHVLPAESRVYLIYQENRVNTPATESRVLLVDQETRIHYLPIPPLTNIASTPYERAI